LFTSRELGKIALPRPWQNDQPTNDKEFVMSIDLITLGSASRETRGVSPIALENCQYQDPAGVKTEDFFQRFEGSEEA